MRALGYGWYDSDGIFLFHIVSEISHPSKLCFVMSMAALVHAGFLDTI